MYSRQTAFYSSTFLIYTSFPPRFQGGTYIYTTPQKTCQAVPPKKPPKKVKKVEKNHSSPQMAPEMAMQTGRGLTRSTDCAIYGVAD
jgi:hypothetical protein